MNNIAPPPVRKLVFDDEVITSAMTQVMLIDTKLSYFQKYANANTFPVVYDPMCSGEQLVEVLTQKFPQFNIHRIVVVSYYENKPVFLDNNPLFESSSFIVELIKKFKVANIDFLACNTLQSQEWKNYYSALQRDTSVIVGASDDKTGNIKYGGDWVMESTHEDIKTIYFNEQIQQYASLLDTVTVNNVNYATSYDNTYAIVTGVDSANLPVNWNGTLTIYPSVNISGTVYPVTRIENNSFSQLSGLNTITIPNSITTVGTFAFFNTGLTSITLPNVTSIGEYAFIYCLNLTSITMPNIISIELNSFQGCLLLSNIYVGTSNPNYTFSGGALYNNSQTILYYICGINVLTTYTVKSGVTTLYNNLFMNCTTLTSIIIPNSVISIGVDTFNNCSSLQSITAQNVTSIGDSGFNGCSSLTSVTLPSVTSIGDSGFTGCSSLTSVTLPRVTSIGDNGFNGCSSLTSVTLPSIISIGENAFYGCSSLTSVPQTNICFKAGTKIVTDQGIVSIEKITRENSIRGKKVLYVSKTENISEDMIIIKKGGLYDSVPNADTYLTEEHKIFYNREMIKVKHLVNGETIIRKKMRKEKVYNVLLEGETSGKMIANGLISETLDPRSPMVKLLLTLEEMSDSDKEEIIKVVNKKMKKEHEKRETKKLKYF